MFCCDVNIQTRRAPTVTTILYTKLKFINKHKAAKQRENYTGVIHFVVHVLFLRIGCATYIIRSLYLTALRWFFCGEPKHVAKYSSTSYTKIVAIDGSSTLNFELDNIIVN